MLIPESNLETNAVKDDLILIYAAASSRRVIFSSRNEDSNRDAKKLNKDEQNAQ